MKRLAAIATLTALSTVYAIDASQALSEPGNLSLNPDSAAFGKGFRTSSSPGSSQTQSANHNRPYSLPQFMESPREQAVGITSISLPSAINEMIISTGEKTLDAVKKAASQFSFNYSAKFLGPGLSGNMQDGATFNRFKTGQSSSGSEYDYTGSYQTYHAFGLGYRLPKNMKISYGVTLQDDHNDVVVSGGGTVQKSRSYNNHQVSLWIPNIFSNSLFYVGTSLIYEIPTTDGSQNNEMRYGLGIQPSLGFYSNVPGLSIGLGASVQRDFYKNDYVYPKWCKQAGFTCNGIPPTPMQVLRVSLSPYLNYSLADKVLLQTSLAFDWDQNADYAKRGKLKNNMNDIYSVGLKYFVSSNLNVSGGLEGSITVPELKRTALFAALGLSI